MRIYKWAVGLAVIAWSASPALGQELLGADIANDYQLASCECAAEPSCEVASECADGCADAAGDACADGCADPCADACCGSVGCGSTCCGDSCPFDSLFPTSCLGEAWDLGDELCGPCRTWDIGGWAQFGYHNRNDGVFNTHPNNLNLHQGWLYAEKVADGSSGLGFGGRADVLYGVDASNTQAFGNPPGSWDFANGWDHGEYSWAMPQLYAEIASGDTSVKVGKFFTPMGYQVVPATGNFFYSIPYTFNFSEAFTHTGFLATHKASDAVTLYGGWTLGWDSGFDQFQGGSNFLGGATVAMSDDVSITYILSAGDLGWIGENAYTHAIVATVNLTDKWQYVGQTDMVTIDNSVNAAGGHYETVGLNNYLFYTINNNWKAGARLEWWKVDGISVYEMAYGLNYKPTANWIIRPEVRYNWAPSDVAPSVVPVVSQLGNGTALSDYNDNTIFGVDAIYTF